MSVTFLVAQGLSQNIETRVAKQQKIQCPAHMQKVPSLEPEDSNADVHENIRSAVCEIVKT